MIVVCQAIFGWAEVRKADYDEASKILKANVKVLNTALEGRKWLVGDEMSIADVAVSQYLSYVLQTVLDGGFRKAMGNVNTWAEACYAHPSVIKVVG
jgi:glutathione S-transferase